MSSSITLLDKYVKAGGHASDSAAARALKVQPSAVNNWRHGRAHPDAESVSRMCEATGESVAHWLPLIEADRARTPEAKKVWLRLAQMAAAITLAVGIAPVHAAAANDAITSASNLHGYTLCEVREAQEAPPHAALVRLQPSEAIWATFSRYARVASTIRPGFPV